MKLKEIKILLADDHPLIRDALRKVLKRCRDFEIVGEAIDGEEAIRLALELVPDVVIMDINMPKISGLEATRKIKEERPNIAVLILTIYDDKQHAFHALECGASGYLTKRVFGQEVIQAVRSVALGEAVLVPAVLKNILAENASHLLKPIPNGFVERLSHREYDIIKLLAHGTSNKEMAYRLDLSLSTVRNNLEQIFSKLSVASRTEAVIVALKSGIITLDDLG